MVHQVETSRHKSEAVEIHRIMESLFDNVVEQKHNGFGRHSLQSVHPTLGLFQRWPSNASDPLLEVALHQEGLQTEQKIILKLSLISTINY